VGRDGNFVPIGKKDWKDIPVKSDRKFCGVIRRREAWRLSWRGWLIVIVALIALSATTLLRIYPFLSVTHRVNAEVLVVEGWVHEYAIQAAVEEFRNNRYRYAISTGGPVVGTGGYINDFNTSASVGADLLKKDGLPNEVVQMVPSRVIDRDRTYGSAIALRNWLREHDPALRSVNVLTEDLHARRSRLLFQKALGDQVAVGVISVLNPDYDSKRWWRYSEGVRDVFSESAAYIYARLFFFPSERSGSTNALARSIADSNNERLR
jgi:uncharacterized SAM-binding protein YcdF (DUF218 family)